MHPLFLNALTRDIGAQQRIALVGHAVYQKPLPCAVAAELFDKRQAIEHMAAVEEERRDGDGEDGHVAPEERYHQHLERACVDKQACRRRPQEIIPCRRHHQTVHRADRKEADKYRHAALKRILKAVFYYIFLHKNISTELCGDYN